MGNAIQGVYLLTDTRFRQYLSDNKDEFIEEIPKSKLFVEHTQTGDRIYVVVDDEYIESANEIIHHYWKIIGRRKFDEPSICV